MSVNLKISPELAVVLTDALKNLEIALKARHQTLEAFTKLYPRHVALLNELLAAELRDPALLQSMKEKYDAILDMMHKEVIDAEAEKAIDQLIEQLRPTDPLN